MAVLEGGNITFEIGDGAGTEVFTAIGQITDFVGPNRILNIINQQFIGSDLPTKTPSNFSIESATFTYSVDPDNTQHDGLVTDRDAKTLRNFQIVDSGATQGTLAFSGYITDVGAPSASGGAELTASVTIEVTTYTAWA